MWRVEQPRQCDKPETYTSSQFHVLNLPILGTVHVWCLRYNPVAYRGELLIAGHFLGGLKVEIMIDVRNIVSIGLIPNTSETG